MAESSCNDNLKSTELNASNLTSDRRKKRRSSFFNKTKLNEDHEESIVVAEEPPTSEAAEESCKRLEAECNDWNTLLWNKKSKYQDALKMSKMPPQKLNQVSSPEFLTAEEKLFLEAGRKLDIELMRETDKLMEKAIILQKQLANYVHATANHVILQEDKLAKQKSNFIDELVSLEDSIGFNFEISESEPKFFT